MSKWFKVYFISSTYAQDICNQSCITNRETPCTNKYLPLHVSFKLTKGLWRYRVTHLQANLGWVDFDLGCVPRLVGRYCSYLLPKQAGGHASTLGFFGRFWPKSRLSSFLLPEPIQGPKKNPMPKRAGGTPQIKVNPTEVRQQMCHQVVYVGSYCQF